MLLITYSLTVGVVDDLVCLDGVVGGFDSDNGEKDGEPPEGLLCEIGLGLVVESLQVAHDPLLEAKVKREGQPRPELPAKEQLVPAVHSQENPRVADSQAKSQGHEQEPAPCVPARQSASSPPGRRSDLAVEVEPDSERCAHREQGMPAWVPVLGRTVEGLDLGGHPKRPRLPIAQLAHVHEEEHGSQHEYIVESSDAFVEL